MKAYGGVDVQIHIFLASALVGGEWSASLPYRFTLAERAHGIYWIGGSVGPRAGLDDGEKRKFLTLPRLELRTLGRPASSQSLYRLRYPGSYHQTKWFQKFHSSSTVLRIRKTALKFVQLSEAFFRATP
jgi:hypothetical protein